MRAALMVLLLAAYPAGGEPWIDGPLLLTQNADRVTQHVEKDGSRVESLTFENGITVACRNGECVGWDSGGPTGCLWNIVTDLRILDQMCGLATRDEAEAILKLEARVAAHVAANAVPPRDLSDLEARYHERLTEAVPATDHGKQALCAYLLQPEHKSRAVLEELLSESFASRIDAMLAEPRLPISLPCPWNLWWR